MKMNQILVLAIACLLNFAGCVSSTPRQTLPQNFTPSWDYGQKSSVPSCMSGVKSLLRAGEIAKAEALWPECQKGGLADLALDVAIRLIDARKWQQTITLVNHFRLHELAAFVNDHRDDSGIYPPYTDPVDEDTLLDDDAYARVLYRLIERERFAAAQIFAKRVTDKFFREVIYWVATDLIQANECDKLGTLLEWAKDAWISEYAAAEFGEQKIECVLPKVKHSPVHNRGQRVVERPLPEFRIENDAPDVAPEPLIEIRLVDEGED